MVRSFHYAAYSSIMESEFDQQNKEGDLDALGRNLVLSGHQDVPARIL